MSICSNVDGYTKPKFILDEDLDSLLTKMISYMNDISDKANLLATERWSDVFDSLISLEGKWLNESENAKNESIQYVLKRVSLGSEDCTKELKLECAYFLGQTS